jgi:hypothetical protein
MLSFRRSFSAFLVALLTLAPMPSDALFLKLLLCKLLKFDIKRCTRAKLPVAPAVPLAPVARAPTAAAAPSPTAVAPTISQPTALAPAAGKAPFVPTKAPANPNPTGPIKAPATAPTKAPVGAASAVRLNEFHYENVGSDAVDYIEVRAGAGLGVSNLKVRYFGSGAELNGELSFPMAAKTTDGLLRVEFARGQAVGTHWCFGHLQFYCRKAN